jgi:hypothetical protein
LKIKKTSKSEKITLQVTNKILKEIMEPKWQFELKDQSINELEESLTKGPIIEFQGNEVYMLNENLICTIKPLKIYIYASEHPPPHFHVKYNGEENSFSILDGSPLYPNNGLNSYFRNIKNWFKKNQKKLITEWNRLRPTDCPIGKYRYSNKKM